MFTLSHLPARSRAGLLFAPLALLLVWLLLASPAHAKRVALVVGNAAYADKPLRNPVNDAELMQRTLQGLGFDVSLVRNADRRGLLAGLRDFEAKARNADVALFYFAGHGTQVGGNNYLLPLQAQIRAESDVPDEAVDANSVLRRIEDAKAKVGLVILDACRDNPYAGSTRTSSRGLGRMSVPTGSIVAYATAPGSTAEDGSGRNGVYTEQLARQLATPGLDLREVFDRTATEVERITGGKQKPREDVGLRGRVVLKDGPATNGTQVASVGVESTGRPLQTDPEEEAWAAAKAANSAAAYDAYLADYPGGKFATAARIARASVVTGQANNNAVNTPSGQQGAQGGAQASGTARHAFEPVMVVIPAGSFIMGSKDGEADEQPTRRVNIRSFALGKYEVTQGQWKAVMGNNPSRFSDCGDNCPVENVSWNDIQQYIQKLNQMTGKQYRLPSEAEWEYAARAGSTGEWSFGNDESQLGRYVWYSANSNSRTQPMGRKQANAFGLHDMHGNVWEWVQDVWHDNYSGAPTDGSAWTTGGDQPSRVLRGGSWNNYPDVLRSANRGGNTPDNRNLINGFRIARTVP